MKNEDPSLRELDTFSPEAIISEDWFKVGTGRQRMT